MSVPFFSVVVPKSPRAIEVLAAMDQDARYAQLSAIRAALRKGRSLASKAMSGRTGVVQKVFRRRIAWYRRRAEGPGQARGVLWGGFKRQPRSTEHPSVFRAIRMQKPDTITKLFGGQLTLVHRRGKKYQDAWLEIAQPLQDELERAASTAMDETYTRTIKRDFERRLERRAGRRR